MRFPFDVEEGAPVYDAEGLLVGHLGQRLEGGGSHGATFITIEKGIALREEHLVPTEVIARVDDEGRARLAITTAKVRELPVYDGDAPTESEARAALHAIWDAMQRQQGPEHVSPEGIPGVGQERSPEGRVDREPGTKPARGDDRWPYRPKDEA